MRDRRLAEMMGWKSIEDHIYRLPNGDLSLGIPDFSTPEWRARLMDWAIQQGWWPVFEYYAAKKYEHYLMEEGPIGVSAYLWRNLAPLVDEYKEGR